MKKLIIITIILIASVVGFGQDSIRFQDLQDSDQLRIESLKQSIYEANVAATVQKLMLAFGTVECSKDTLQTMISRDQHGNYYLHVSAFTFPLTEGRILLSIPEKNRAVLRELDINSGVIEINKFELEKETRIDGKPMPNYKITINE